MLAALATAVLASVFISLAHFGFSNPRIKFPLKSGGQVSALGTCPLCMRLLKSLSVLNFLSDHRWQT